MGGQFGKAASFPEQGYNNWTWWSMPITPALRRPRQEDWDFRTSAGPCLKNKVKVNQSIKVLWMKLRLEILYLEPRVFGGDQSLLKSICRVGIVTHICNPSTGKGEPRGGSLQVRTQPGLLTRF